MLSCWEHESHKQFLNSSELIQILVYFITLCPGRSCTVHYIIQGIVQGMVVGFLTSKSEKTFQNSHEYLGIILKDKCLVLTLI